MSAAAHPANAVPCRTCHALAGEPCRGAGGEARTHDSRIADWPGNGLPMPNPLTPEERGLRLRPEVRRFAEAMERALRKNDAVKGRKGWKDDHEMELFERVEEELAELRAVLGVTCTHCGHRPKTRAKHKTILQRIEREAADVANMLMMVVDVACWSDE